MSETLQKRKRVDEDTNSSSDSSSSGDGSSSRINLNFHELADPQDDLSMTLERLADGVLQKIFEYLNSTELRTLCEISRSVYEPAAKCLYHRIIITSRDCEYVRRDVQTWTSRKCTVTCKPKALVVSVLANQKLASFIETIIVHQEKGEEDQSWIPLICVCGNLRFFHNRDDSSHDEAVYGRVFGATCHVKKMPIFGSNLTELRLVYACDDQSRERFTDVANWMIHTKAYVNLKTLLINHETPFYYGLALMISWPEEAPGDPYWLSFFKVFDDSDITLNLETLGLDGHFAWQAKKVADIVVSVVDTTILKTLELIFNEDAHFDIMHEDVSSVQPGIFELLTKFIMSLDNLYLNCNYYCSMCTDSFITHVFKEHLRGQLKQLYIETVPVEEFDFILQDIVRSQPKLKKLEVELAEPIFNVNITIPNIEDLFFLSEESAEILLCRREYTPCFNFTHSGKPYISAKAERKLRKYLQSFYQYLPYITVYGDRQYYRDPGFEFTYCGFRLDMEDERLLLNDTSIDLDP